MYEVIAAILAALASAGGAYAQNRSINQQVEGAAEAERRERFRQAELQRQADQRLREEIVQFTPEQQQRDLAQATATREAAYQPPAPPSADYQATTVAAPKEVKGDLDRRLGDATSVARENAMRRARLEAFGDVAQGQQFQMNRLGEDLRRVSTDSAASSRLLPFQLRTAAGAGRRNAQAADIYNTIGQMGAYYAMTGGKPRAADASVRSVPTSQWPTPI